MLPGRRQYEQPRAGSAAMRELRGGDVFVSVELAPNLLAMRCGRTEIGSLKTTGYGTAGVYANDRGQQSPGASWRRKRVRLYWLLGGARKVQNNLRVRTDGHAPWGRTALPWSASLLADRRGTVLSSGTLKTLQCL